MHSADNKQVINKPRASGLLGGPVGGLVSRLF